MAFLLERNRPQDAETEMRAHELVKSGGVSEEEAWELYLDNIRVVLDEIELLRENLDYPSMVITADHGEYMGELGMYGHVEGHPHPAVRKVPWAYTTATDSETHEPDERHLDRIGEPGEGEVEDRLEDLGYTL